MAHSLATLFNSIINPKRDYVSANTPTDQLLKTFLDMPEGARRSASYSRSDTGGQDPAYPWPDLWPDVYSQKPGAGQLADLNEQTLQEYIEAMNVYNQGGKAERILSLIGGAGTAGGYIADRTSGDPERRARAGGPGGDLDYALENVFALPNQLNQRRRGKMESAMRLSDVKRGFGKESLGAMSKAEERDNYWKYMWQRLGVGAAQERARIGGSTQREALRDKEWKEAERLFYSKYASQIGPGKLYANQTEALEAMAQQDEFEHSKLMDIWKIKYEAPGDTYSAWDAEAEKAWYQLYGKEWENAEGDDDKRKQMLSDKLRFKQKWLTDKIRWGGKKVDPTILDDIFPPAQPGDEITGEEERGFLDKALGGLGGIFGVGTEGSGLGGAIEGWGGEGLDEDTAAAVESISGEQAAPQGEIIDEDSRGWLIKRPDGTEEWVRKPRTGGQEEEQSEGALNFGDILEYLNTLK